MSLRTGATVVAVALVAVLIGGAATAAGGPSTAEARGKSATVKRYPWEKRTRDAARFASRRAGVASFALIDEFGRMHAYNRGAHYSSASLVKAMLLVAYLRKGNVKNRRLHGSELGTLGPMIRVSDNDAANAIMARVGTGGLSRLAHRAGMRRFIPDEVWGGSQITARDQAVFFSKIRRLIPGRHRSYAMELLADITGGQRWGVTQGAPSQWRLHFKGGWFPSGGWRVHQAALLVRGKRQLSVAVLTQGSPTLGYGAATIAGVVRRLTRGYNRFDPPRSGKKKRGQQKE